MSGETTRTGLANYLEPRVLATFFFGMSSGFPLTFVISITGFWLSRFGVSKETVGLFALATMPYAWKFLWSPLIDRLPLGRLGRWMGHRRSWLLLIQALMALALFALSGLNPADDIGAIAALVLAVGFLSASQDIVIDAYRIELLDTRQQGFGAAMTTFGYRAGNLIVGYGVLMLAEVIGWSAAIALQVLLLAPALVAALLIGEPNHPPERFARREMNRVAGMTRGRRVLAFLYEAVALPFKEFTRRDNWLLILAFIFFFKMGDAITAIMTAPLLVELNFTDAEIANANKLVGTIALWTGIALGSWVYWRLGTFRALLLSGVLMMLTNLVFAWLSQQGADVVALAVTIGAENFSTGLGTTVTVAYLSGLCNLSFTATQYALLSSLASQARALVGAFSGELAAGTGWVMFFVLATLAAVPGLVLLGVMWRRGVVGETPKAGSNAGGAQ
ncbi:AmpG family muropeptide MFS transporter [Yunchengibacter salinarum]|uniref:AmpG family muropeptide MFS transporter n=1 Tax=Yunchengibacter salinarum TaxID=3133399 RepID=UPI0035B5CBDA